MADKDPKLTNTARVNFEPKIEQPVRDIELEIGDLTDLEGLFRRPDELEKVSEEDVALINEYHQQFEDVRNQLNEFDEVLDKKLQGMQLKYDPDNYPLLHAAQQHGPCGRPGATNVITYDDLKSRWALERAQFRRGIGIPKTLDEMDRFGSDFQADQEKLTNDNIQKMLALVLKQILVWVLEFFLKLMSPLKGVPGAKKIPASIQSAIDGLQRGRSVDRGPQSVLDSLQGKGVQVPGDTIIGTQDLSSAGGGLVTGARELSEAAEELLPSECLAHTANWLKAVDQFILDQPEFTGAYLGKKLNIQMQRRMDSLDKMAGLGIPDKHTITRTNGTTLSYSNPLPEEYLRARADGSTKFKAFGKGLINSVKGVAKTFIPRMKKLIVRLAADPSLLCCLVRNLKFLGTAKKLRKILLFIQALLRVWKNLLLIDINAELTKLGNLVIDLLNATLQTIFSAFTAFFYNKLNNTVLGIGDLDKLLQTSRECKPWIDLLELASEILKEMLQKIVDYLIGFFTNFKLDIERLSRTAEKSDMVEFINKLLRLIDAILKFSVAWQFCVESGQDPRVILGGGDRLSIRDGIVLGPPSATNISDGNAGSIKAIPPGSGDDIIFSQTSGSSTQGDGRGLAADGPFSSDGLQILLTNYLGVSNKQANKIVGDIDSGDCACDKALSPEELATLEALVKERS